MTSVKKFIWSRLAAVLALIGVVLSLVLVLASSNGARMMDIVITSFAVITIFFSAYIATDEARNS